MCESSLTSSFLMSPLILTQVFVIYIDPVRNLLRLRSSSFPDTQVFLRCIAFPWSRVPGIVSDTLLRFAKRFVKAIFKMRFLGSLIPCTVVRQHHIHWTDVDDPA